MNSYPYAQILEYTKTSTPNSLLADMDFYLFFSRKIIMNAKTPKQSYEIIHHKRGMLLRINGKFVPNRRGRPKHFPLPKHIRQYLVKMGGAA